MNGNERRLHEGAVVREQRRLRSMKQAELAVLVGIGQTALSRYESGEREIPPLIRHALALVFGVNPARLFRAPATRGAADELAS